MELTGTVDFLPLSDMYRNAPEGDTCILLAQEKSHTLVHLESVELIESDTLVLYDDTITMHGTVHSIAKDTNQILQTATVNISGSPSNVKVGDIIRQDQQEAEVVHADGNEIYMASTTNMANGRAQLLHPVPDTTSTLVTDIPTAFPQSMDIEVEDGTNFIPEGGSIIISFDDSVFRYTYAVSMETY